MRARIATLVVTSMIAGCGATFNGVGLQVKSSIAENESGYTYIPIDPFKVETILTEGCGPAAKDTTEKLLSSLPDNAVRMLVEQFDKSGAVTYGASKASVKDGSYRVTVDYINADTISIRVRITKFMQPKAGDPSPVPVNLYGIEPDNVTPGSETYKVERLDSAQAVLDSGVLSIPIYVGVGLRVSSYVHALEGNANISGIGVIGAEAEANRLRGSLIVQTLGVNGKSVAAALPIQSELNRTTAQNAIVAVGSIKALLYAPETIASPRVVGMYLPFPGSKGLVNAIISELSKQPPEWKRHCPLISKA